MKDATLEIDGHVVHVADGPCLHDGNPTPAARDFAAKLIQQLDEMRVFAAQELLDLYNNGDWRGEEDPILNQHEFCSRLIDPHIDLYDVGTAAIYFDPSGMFSDHHIEVCVEDGKIAYADMVG